MESPFADKFPEVIDRLLALSDAASSLAASRLVQSQSLRKHSRFLFWIEKALTIPNVAGYIGSAFSMAAADPILMDALLIYIEAMQHADNARNLIMYMYDKPDLLEAYRPALRVFYRSEAFIDHLTWGTETYGKVLKDMFRTDEPELTAA